MVPMATQIAPQPFSLSPRSLLYAGISSSPGRSNPKSPHLRRRPAPPPGRARDPRRAGAARPLAAPRGSGGPGSLSASDASPGPPVLGTCPPSVCRKDGWTGRKLQTRAPVNATQPIWQQDHLSEGPSRTYLTGLSDPQTRCPRLLLRPQGPSPRALGPEHSRPGSLPDVALPGPLFSVCTECFSRSADCAPYKLAGSVTLLAPGGGGLACSRQQLSPGILGGPGNAGRWAGPGISAPLLTPCPPRVPGVLGSTALLWPPSLGVGA
ncbi:unnamed protein product [Rangifer tarandus platyrhynchus]|uniref:Uncharacterized protein n=2 Tax=Rangifer tarandus platyrhynchus TaxID=3082113 RepID=A0ABN8YEK9_RANTA|nr:unnamed protein product [Rangifer tarandus platyrhynchus]